MKESHHTGLILRRKPQEIVNLRLPNGEMIVITNIGNKDARLNINAPADVKIWRDEIEEV